MALKPLKHLKPFAPRKPHGFSLIELILVLVLIGIMLGVAGASLSGMVRRSTLKATADELQTLIEQARAQAMHDGAPQRVVIDTQNRQAFWEPEDPNIPLDVDDRSEDDLPSEPVTWKANIHIETEPPMDGQGRFTIAFDRMGLHNPSWIWVIDAHGKQTLHAGSATEGYRVLDANNPTDQRTLNEAPRDPTFE